MLKRNHQIARNRVSVQKALKLLKEHGKEFDKIFEKVEWNSHFDIPWEDIFYTIKIDLEKY